jgi:hypothetical protein
VIGQNNFTLIITDANTINGVSSPLQKPYDQSSNRIKVIAYCVGGNNCSYSYLKFCLIALIFAILAILL